ncbi:hypothetical protein SteCoe_1941 [Stentor coeruleus]|uniref:non-specific serine/threonine protein kinase n=1 Tax=Stentor coeruleus TaxID=5963 RepID=A0A1R2D0I9_9CILI|nr:hypothetical protein SteCoe_1941 [Stentor coeruleus]
MGQCLGKKAKKEIKTTPKSEKLENPQPVISETTKNISQKLTDIYSLKKVIGQGSFGIVRRGAKLDNPDIQVAIKTITKSKIKHDLSLLKNEVEILSSIDHPNIVKLYDFFDEEYFFNIVTEYCSGGELFEVIIQNGRLNEALVAKYMKKMMRAINHLHKNGICHRDVKPQNFIFESTDTNAELKLIDFGLAHRFTMKKKKGVSMETFAGTPYYLAPEVLKGPYDMKCDIWSLGIIMVLMLTGTHPFSGNCTPEIYKSILNDELNVNSHEFKHISAQGVDLIQKLLVKNPELRFSAEQALTHPWMKQAKEEKVDISIYASLKNFMPPSEMWRAAVGILVKYMSVSEIGALRSAFNEVDIEGTGTLSIKDIEFSLAKTGIILPKRELIEIFKRLDYAQDGKIHYSEFLTATLSSRLCVNEQMMLTLFSYFDIDKSGEITIDNLKVVFKRMGLSYTEEKISHIINEVHLGRKGGITYDEFKIMMTKKAVL